MSLVRSTLIPKASSKRAEEKQARICEASGTSVGREGEIGCLGKLWRD